MWNNMWASQIVKHRATSNCSNTEADANFFKRGSIPVLCAM